MPKLQLAKKGDGTIAKATERSRDRLEPGQRTATLQGMGAWLSRKNFGVRPGFKSQHIVNLKASHFTPTILQLLFKFNLLG